MSADKTPHDPDETLALPVTDPAPAPDTADETLTLPVTGTEPARDPADETLALPRTDAEPTREAAEETRPLPTTTWSDDPAPALDEPAPTTGASPSPIGVLYAPADRPDAYRSDAYRSDASRPDEADPVAPAEPALPPRRLRVGTVVWGLVIAAIGVGVLAWAAGLEIDVQLAMIVLLAAAGAALLLGSIFSGARAARR